MGVRKSFVDLSDQERDRFLEAVLLLKVEFLNNNPLNTYDRYVAMHAAAMQVQTPGSPLSVNMGHLEAGFLPWHRMFLRMFELDLERVKPGAALPYWDWTEATATRDVLFQENFLSTPTVDRGYFAFNAPGTPDNPTPIPGWWPNGLEGFRVLNGLSAGFGTALSRTPNGYEELAWPSEVDEVFGTDSYEAFRQSLEAGPRMHNFGHNWVGGHMSNVLIPPNDPIFFMHHANADKLWNEWQAAGHQGSGFYPDSGEPAGHNLNNLMWPWVGNTPGYASLLIPDWALPSAIGNTQIHPSDLLDIATLNYSYA